MTFLELNGERVLDYLDQLAGLRLRIFRDYPYLYDGTLEEERRYLRGYASQGQALLAVYNGQVVGAITGKPLTDESEAFVAPFRAAGLVPDQYYYIGELLFELPCRRQGWGSRLLARLEQLVAEQNQYAYYCLATVVRPDDHPLRPDGFIPIEGFCQHHGYQPVEGAVLQLTWREINGQSTSNTLMFWQKPVNRAAGGKQCP